MLVFSNSRNSPKKTFGCHKWSKNRVGEDIFEISISLRQFCLFHVQSDESIELPLSIIVVISNYGAISFNSGLVNWLQTLCIDFLQTLTIANVKVKFCWGNSFENVTQNISEAISPQQLLFYFNVNKFFMSTSKSLKPHRNL